MTKRFSSHGIRAGKLHCCQVEWARKNGNWKMTEVAGSDFEIKTDLVLLALGFVHVEHDGLVHDLDLKLDSRGNVLADNYQTNQPWVFAAGDTVIGASLVVRAINAGREAAEAIDKWLREKG